MTEMAKKNQQTAKPISDLQNGQDGNASDSQAHTQNSSQVGTKRARPAVKGVLERAWRRRNDINSLPGLIREHGRLIAAMHTGRMGLDTGEILSRAYARHREMVTALEQNTYLQTIQAQLEAIQRKSAFPLLDGVST